MRKYVRLLAAALVILQSLCVFSISGCGSKNMPIEPAQWEMSTIQDKNGNVIFCSENVKSSFPDAKVKSVSCTIDGEYITIKNEENGEEWEGTYQKADQSEEASLYEVVFGNGEKGAGMIVNSMTEYEDKTEPENTLIISYGGYTLAFM
ncbi:MAG: hypothetical protein KHX56_15900 [Clostridiales bacterium]|nr:hypothetical protein [Clostridiales bacterium]